MRELQPYDFLQRKMQSLPVNMHVIFLMFLKKVDVESTNNPYLNRSIIDDSPLACPVSSMFASLQQVHF